MFTGKLAFAQVMDFLPLHTFWRCVQRYPSNYPTKTFSHLDQFLCMAFAQLTFRDSLRDIEVCLRAHASKLYHLGIRGHVARSTLADANEKRDWRIYHDFANALIATARKLYADEDFGVDLANTVYALDTTTIDLSLSVFPWAHFRTTKAAVKMHTQIDLRGNIPSFIHVSDGKMHEVNAPRKMPSKPKSGSRSPSTCSSPSSKSAWTCRRRSTQFCRFSVSHSLKKHHSINCLTTSQPKLSTQTSLTK